MNPQFRTKVVSIWKCRKCHKDYDNYKEASECCTDDKKLKKKRGYIKWQTITVFL